MSAAARCDRQSDWDWDVEADAGESLDMVMTCGAPEGRESRHLLSFL